MHSEAKQSETSEFGAERGLLQGHARRWVAHALKIPELPEGFLRQSIFKSQVSGVGLRVCDQLMHNSLADGEGTGHCNRG